MWGDSRDWKTRSPWGWVCACRVNREGFIHTSETSICPSPCCSQDLRSRMMPDTMLQWETERDHSKLWHLSATHFTLTLLFSIFCSKCCWYSKLIGQFRQCVSESGGFYSLSVSDNTAIGARAGDKTLMWITGDWNYRCRWSTRGDNEVCVDLRISLCYIIMIKDKEVEGTVYIILVSSVSLHTNALSLLTQSNNSPYQGFKVTRFASFVFNLWLSWYS